jgi:hypothetical protein
MAEFELLNPKFVGCTVIALQVGDTTSFHPERRPSVVLQLLHMFFKPSAVCRYHLLVLFPPSVTKSRFVM